MEPKFSNSCRCSRENLKEAAGTALPKWYKIFCIVFTVFLAAAALLSLLAGRTAIAVIAIIAVIIMIFALHKLTSQIDKTYKTYLEKFGGEAEIRLFFYDDIIVGKNLTAGSTVKAEYSQITNISETKNLYVLGLSGISILVDKNGFIGGNGAEFSKFIHEKCSKER